MKKSTVALGHPSTCRCGGHGRVTTGFTYTPQVVTTTPGVKRETKVCPGK